MITWKFGYSCHLSDIASFIICWAVLPQHTAVGFRVTVNFNFLADLRLPKPPSFCSFRNLFLNCRFMQKFISWFTKNRKDRSKFALFHEATADLSRLEGYFSNSAVMAPNFIVNKTFFKPCLLCFSFKRYQKCFSSVR